MSLHLQPPDGERSRMMVFSKRQSPPRKRKDEREERDKEEAAEFEMKLANIVAKRPDKRLKWLQKGMLLIGRKMLKASDFYELVMDKAFISDAPAEVGARMKASILANLHLFSSKQQKALQSESCHFNQFSSASSKDRSAKEPKRPPEREGGEGKKKPRKRRAKDSRGSEDDVDSLDSRAPPPRAMIAEMIGVTRTETELTTVASTLVGRPTTATEQEPWCPTESR
eukprot:s5490_g3.t1